MIDSGRKHDQEVACLRLLLFLLLPFGVLSAEPIPVRFQEGSVHGFLALHSLDGKLLATGDLTQVVHGNRVVSHLVFRFRDGSIDDETAVFSQRGAFHVISDRHIQKGPIFPQPTDLSMDTATGQVTVRYQDKGHVKVEKEHFDLPSDLANGILFDIIKNIPPDSKETKVSYVAATPKPRVVKLSIKPDGEEGFSIVGSHYKAVRFTIKVELGGIAGMIAPMVGKQPVDTHVWVVGGEAPAFVKSEGPLFGTGPVWRIEMTSPQWR
jgi:hypothetical protein